MAETKKEAKRQPNLYFSAGDTSQGYEKKDDPEAIHREVIREHIAEQIAKDEAKGLKAPRHDVAVPTGKLQVKRPVGTLETLQKADMDAIKASVQQSLRRKQSQASSAVPDRVSTGINGLDSVMEGGLRPNTVTLIGGGAGSGKSIFGMQFLIDGIEQRSEPGVYLTFEQTPEELFTDLERFGWELEQKVAEKKLTVLHYTPEQVQKVLEAGGGTVRDVIESAKAKRLVIDSLTAFTLLHDNQLAQRHAAFQLFEAIKHWGCTAFVISEQEPDPERHYSDIMEFQVDGVILLYNIRKGDIRERSLEIFKMRGVRHAAKIFPMKITSKGIQIYPEETVF